MIGEELLPAETVKASLLKCNKSVDLPLKETDILQTLDGTATGKFSKTLIVVEASDRSYEKVLGHRLEIVPNTDPTAARISTCSKPSWFFRGIAPG